MFLSYLSTFLLLSCVDNYAKCHRVGGENNFIDRVAGHSACTYEYDFTDFKNENPCDLPTLKVEYPGLELPACDKLVSKDSTSSAPAVKYTGAKSVGKRS